MTTTAATTTDRRAALRRSRRRTLVAVYATAATTFTLVAAGLGLGMARGHDPALGAANADADIPVRRVVIRRIHAAPGAVASQPMTEAAPEPEPAPVDTATS